MSMTFAQVKTEVASWLLDAPSGMTTRLDGWVNEAVRDACKRHNFRFMESAVAETQTASLTRVLVAKPADWKEARGFPYYVNQDGSTTEFDFAASQSAMNRTYADRVPQETSTAAPDSGSPHYILEKDTQLQVWPLPDLLSGWTNGNYRVNVPYWAFPAVLVADSDTNFFTQNHEYYLIWKACAIGFGWNRDEDRALLFANQAEPLFQRLKNLDKLSRLGDRLTLAAHKDVLAGSPRGRSNREG